MAPLTHPINTKLNKDLIEKILSFLSRNDLVLAMSDDRNDFFLPYMMERVDETKGSLDLLLKKLPATRFEDVRSLIREKMNQRDSFRISPGASTMLIWLSDVKASLIDICAGMDDTTSHKLLMDDKDGFLKDTYSCSRRIREINAKRDNLLSSEPLEASMEAEEIFEGYLECGLTEKANQFMELIPGLGFRQEFPNSLETLSIGKYTALQRENRICKLILSFKGDGKLEEARWVYRSFRLDLGMNMIRAAANLGDISATRLILGYYYDAYIYSNRLFPGSWGDHYIYSMAHRFLAAQNHMGCKCEFNSGRFYAQHVPKGSLNLMKVLLPKEVSLSADSSYRCIQNDVLAYAANHGTLEDVEFFLPKTKWKLGTTPLFCANLLDAIKSAAEKNDLAMVRTLFSTIDTVEEDLQIDMLNEAVGSGNTEVVAELLRHLPISKDTRGLATVRAAMANNLDMVRLLLENGPINQAHKYEAVSQATDADVRDFLIEYKLKSKSSCTIA
jgi:hypothetical protein